MYSHEECPRKYLWLPRISLRQAIYRAGLLIEEDHE